MHWPMNGLSVRLLGCAGWLGEGKCLRDPSVHDGGESSGTAKIIYLRLLPPSEHVKFHERSPPSPRFLCLIVWWPTPLPPDPETERGRGLRNLTRRNRHIARKRDGWVEDLKGQLHLAGVRRDGLGHETLEVATQTDAFHSDQSLLCQHRPENTITQMKKVLKQSKES